MAACCQWAEKIPVLRDYHDFEWGRPTMDDADLFAKLCLQILQPPVKAGDSSDAEYSFYQLRGIYLASFYHFEPNQLANMEIGKIDEFIKEQKGNEDRIAKGVCVNKQKLKSLITNANAYISLQKEGLSLTDVCWAFAGGHMIMSAKSDEEIQKMASDMSAALKTRGFAGVTIAVCSGFMKASGMVNAHDPDCPARMECMEDAKLVGRF